MNFQSPQSNNVVKFISRHHASLAFILFLCISILYFGIHIFSAFSTAVIGGFGDPPHYVWYYAWWAHALTHGINPFLPKTIWAPLGFNLAQANSIPALAILFAPITLIWGPYASYNCVILLTAALAAWTSYLLCDYIVNSKRYALFGGYIYGFTFFMLPQLGHTNLFASAFLLPALILVYLKFLNENLSSKKFVLSTALMLTVLFLISTEITVVFSCFAFLATIMAAYYFPGYYQKIAKSIKFLILSYAIVIIIVSPYLYYFFTYNLAVSSGSFKGWKAANDLLSLIVPSKVYFFSSAYTIKITKSFTLNGSEWNAYFGIGLIFLLIVYAKQFWVKPLTRYLIILIVIITILSLGAVLRVGGHQVLTFPWYPLFEAFVFGKAIPSRFGLYVCLMLAICVSYWLKNSPWKLRYRLLLVFLSLALLFPSFDLSKRHIFIKFHIPKFFISGIYRHYIKESDNVLFLPMKHSVAELWQLKTNFYMHLATTNIASSTPAIMYSQDPIYDELHGQKNITVKDFALFLKRHAITKIIITKNAPIKNLRPQTKYILILNKIDPHPISIAGVTVYTVNMHRLKYIISSS